MLENNEAAQNAEELGAPSDVTVPEAEVGQETSTPAPKVKKRTSRKRKNQQAEEPAPADQPGEGDQAEPAAGAVGGSGQATGTPDLREMSPDELQVDLDVQMRESMDDATVMRYFEKMRANEPFPPVIAFDDGERLWLADGFHRHAAAKKVGVKLAVEVRKGSRTAALIHDAGANEEHGLPRTIKDKRRSVEAVLALEKFCNESDHTIAKTCRVSHMLVGKIRKEMAATLPNGAKSSCVRSVNRGGTTFEMETKKIGSNQKKKPKASDVTPPEPAEPSAEPIDSAKSTTTRVNSNPTPSKPNPLVPTVDHNVDLHELIEKTPAPGPPMLAAIDPASVSEFDMVDSEKGHGFSQVKTEGDAGGGHSTVDNTDSSNLFGHLGRLKAVAMVIVLNRPDHAAQVVEDICQVLANVATSPSTNQTAKVLGETIDRFNKIVKDRTGEK